MIKSFKLGGIDWVVKEVDHIEDDCIGTCYSSIHKILIANKYKDRVLSGQGKDLTLYHEALHAMLDSIGRNDLSTDETFVESLSLMMHQFESTKK